MSSVDNRPTHISQFISLTICIPDNSSWSNLARLSVQTMDLTRIEKRYFMARVWMGVRMSRKAMPTRELGPMRTMRIMMTTMSCLLGGGC